MQAQKRVSEKEKASTIERKYESDFRKEKDKFRLHNDLLLLLLQHFPVIRNG